MNEKPTGASENWKERTYGVLPEGSRVKTGIIDTKTYIEQGERTWTTGQTVRDTFQNHLDANTQKYFDTLVSSVIDIDRLKEKPEQEQNNFDEFTYALFRFKKGLGDFSPEAKAEFISILEQYVEGLPLKPEVVDSEGGINLESLIATVSGIQEIPPQIRYRVIDQHQAAKDQSPQWVDWQDMQLPPYDEQIIPSDVMKESDSDLFRYRIVGVQILDEGSGFDSKLTAFYKSTKTGKRHLRGKFGEGAKMSEAHLMRHGAKVKIRSRYEIHGDENRDRVWQQRPYVGEDKTIKQRSTEVDIPRSEKAQSGSFTLIDIQKSDSLFQEDFIKNIDPRIAGQGLGLNCLGYSPSIYHYPAVRIDQYTKPVGVSLEIPSDYQYVQGLRVGEGGKADDYNAPLFSYDFLDSTLLRGRDRSELKNGVSNLIHRFWSHAESPELLEELVRRSLLDSNVVSRNPPEFDALRDLIGIDSRYLVDPQAQRTQDTVLQIMPKILGILPGRKNVVVSQHDLSRQENKSMIHTLEVKGYHIVTIANTVISGNYEKLNEYHRGRFEVYTLDSLRKDIDALVGEMEHKNEKVQLSEIIYESARGELNELIARANLDDTIDVSMGSPVFLETVDPKTELAVEVFFDEEAGRFRLTIRPDLVIDGHENGRDADYWKKRMQVEMLATLGRKESYPDRNTALMQSQENAQELLNKTLRQGMPDIDALPVSFDHEVESQSETAAIDSFAERLKNIEVSLEGMAFYDKARKFHLTLNDLEDVVQKFPDFSLEYKTEIEKILTSRLIIENGDVGYVDFDYTPKGKEMILKREKINESMVVSVLGDRNVYRIHNRLFVFCDMPQDSVIKMNKYHTYVSYKDSMLDFRDHNLEIYEFNSFPVRMDQGCLSVALPGYKNDITSELSTLEKGLSEIVITSPEREKSLRMKMLEGVVETPLPVEYGRDEWDNPVRVFEDIVQNHIDAAPDGRAGRKYEVVREGKRLWVDQEIISDTDQIIGLAITDQGGGYLPDDIGTVGKSSKKSPLFAGKYGEGQKMISAAAVRNGLSLSFTSLGESEGKRYRWIAQASARDEELIIDGEKSQEQRVIFDLKSALEESDEQFVSATVLQLPDAENYHDPLWQKWLEIFDPREKDERGNGGLSRYVINLREGNNPSVIDLGYMRILLDEPGAIYENGLLISRKVDATAMGYDVPEIVTTRERNSYNTFKLSGYIAHAMTECRDDRYSQMILKRFKERYLGEMIKNKGQTRIHEADMDFGSVFLVNSDFLSTQPLWNYAYATELGGYVIHSEEALRAGIAMSEKFLREGLVSNREKMQVEIESAWTTLANMGHISKDRIIELRKDDYRAWAKIFPTAADYVKNLAEQRILVSAQTAQELTRVVAASGSVIRRMSSEMQQDEEMNKTYVSILTGKVSSGIENYQEEQAKRKAQGQLAFWSDYNELVKQNAVFVAPANAGYLGIASKESIGLNELLLKDQDPRNLIGTIRHELLHKVFGLRDYTPEFIMLLLELADANTQ